ncbi:Nucleolar protein 12 [Malassezia sp. CBS 17886]|nr:Nucleolar protein 12 [Malassezia sp. CBS 17886]
MGKRRAAATKRAPPAATGAAVDAGPQRLFGTASSGFDAELDAIFRAPQRPPSGAVGKGAESRTGSARAADGPAEESAEEDAGRGVDVDETQGPVTETQSDNDSAVEADEPARSESRSGADDADPTDASEDEVFSEADEDWDEETLPAFLQDSASPAPASEKRTQKVVLLEHASDSVEARNKRTLFLGNVPISAVSNRAMRKELIRHVESLSPYPECTCIVALRFRSLALRTPAGESTPPPDSARADTASSRRKERAHKFRELQGADAGEKTQAPLTGAQKRKVAYINKDINERAEAVHAYVRIGDPRLVYALREQQARQAERSVPRFDERVSGGVLAALLATAVDNSVLGGRHLRADLITPLAPHEVIAAGLDRLPEARAARIGGSSLSAADPRRTVFVGNLDFETGEEELRALFEKLLQEERGRPPSSRTTALRLDGTVVAGAERPGAWVQSVRIVRDKATQLGKGFAYVKLADTQCVDEMLALHDTENAFVAARQRPAEGSEPFRRRLKLRKRALRVSRCRGGGDAPPRGQKRPAGRDFDSPRTPHRNAPARVRSSGAPTPNGSSPTPQSAASAAHLATLSKDQRAFVKKNDAARQARRLQKKQGKRQADKAVQSVGSGRERVKLPAPSTVRRANAGRGKGR